MTEKDADERLINGHDEYFKDYSRITRYAAVVKQSNNAKISDDYYIEIGYDNGDVETDFKIFAKNLKDNSSLIKRLGISAAVEQDIKDGIVEINGSPEICYQNCRKSKKKSNNLLDCQGELMEEKRRFSKLTGGISVYDNIDAEHSGTAGVIFHNSFDNCNYLLSNNHVLIGAETNNPNLVVHPSKHDSYNLCSTDYLVIGEVCWYQEISEDQINLIDAALVRLAKNIKIDFGRFTRCDEVKFLGLSEPKIGQKVKKCGRTTGFRTGEIRSINATVNISNNKSKNHIYKNQILTTLMTCPGDSGSILVDENNMIVGMFFAGDQYKNSFANNIDKVVEQMNIDVPKIKLELFL